MVQLTKIVPPGSAKVFVKLEYFNPAESHKDRIAYYMIKEAIERENLKPGGLFVEASSGNTGIAVAWVCNLLGYKLILVAPKETSPAKIKLLKLLGAEVVLVDQEKGFESCIEKAKELAEEKSGVYLNQFENKANIKAHYETTGPEIWRQTKGKVDVFVMGVGTGGTIMGVGKYLKERKTRGKDSSCCTERFTTSWRRKRGKNRGTSR